ncbi:MAG: hypothetical protein M1395_06120 [Bacteroidetes bacterium]|nr:hypothetical protein [Bacteroidota bacterium]
MKTIDCAIFYEWEYDADFISVLSNKFSSKNISYQVIYVTEFEKTLEEVRHRAISFRSVVDRASDVDEACEAIIHLLKHRDIPILNDPLKITHASDKASMHLEFITAGIHVPYTIIISPYNSQREVKLSLSELAQLGRPFIIKPANTTGGGIGVVTGAEGLREVVDTRQHNKDDKYLLQQRIEPVVFDGRRAWFRPFYVYGEVFVCWWDDLTHLYVEASEADMNRYSLHEIKNIVRMIYSVCGLDFFSTEIALTAERKFVVIDYVNEICDMRLKSKHYDGVPDNMVEAIADQIAAGIARTIEMH